MTGRTDFISSDTEKISKVQHSFSGDWSYGSSVAYVAAYYNL